MLSSRNDHNGQEDWVPTSWVWLSAITLVVWILTIHTSYWLGYWTAYLSVEKLASVYEDSQSLATAIGIIVGIGVPISLLMVLLTVVIRRNGGSRRSYWGDPFGLPYLFLAFGIGPCLGHLGSVAGSSNDLESWEIVAAKVLTQGLWGAVFEECLFRGLVLRSMLTNLSNTTSLFASSILFLLPHLFLPLSLVGLVLVFSVGAVSAGLWLKCRSLTPCCVLHASYNIFAIL